MEDNPLEEIYKVITYVVSVVVLFAIGWLFFVYRVTLLLFAIAVFVTALLMLGDFTVRRLTRYEHRGDVGQFGTLLQRFHMIKEVRPLALASPASDTAKTKVTITVPTVAELLKSGAFGTTSLLFGFLAENGSAHWGCWSDINTFAIAGKSRSGKTITLFFIILQALFNHAVVWICDPHGAGRKQSALKKLLEPLILFQKRKDMFI
jgi:hypothetical protein